MIAAVWQSAPERETRLRPLWTQAVHWATRSRRFIASRISGFQQLLPNYRLVRLLFAGAWDLSRASPLAGDLLLGLAVALSISAMTWLKQVSLLSLLVGAAIVRFAVAFWSRGSRNLARLSQSLRRSRGIFGAGTRTASRGTQRLAYPAAARISAIVSSERPAAGHCLSRQSRRSNAAPRGAQA